jgi:anti-sigma B factor antagonist
MLSDRIQANPKRFQLLEVFGRVDGENALELGQSVERAVAEGRINLLLDLSGVQYMNSSGLRELVQIYKRLLRIGGSLTVVNPSERVKSLLELVGLETVFDIYFDPLWNPSRYTTATVASLPRQMCYCS